MKQHRAMQINYHKGFLELSHVAKKRVNKGKWDGEELDMPQVKEKYVPPASDYLGRFSDYV